MLLKMMMRVISNPPPCSLLPYKVQQCVLSRIGGHLFSAPSLKQDGSGVIMVMILWPWDGN